MRGDRIAQGGGRRRSHRLIVTARFWVQPRRWRERAGIRPPDRNRHGHGACASYKVYLDRGDLLKQEAILLLEADILVAEGQCLLYAVLLLRSDLLP